MNGVYFALFMGLLIAQRFSELYISARNESHLRKQGGLEYGQSHYPYMVAMHTLFFISMIAEFVFLPGNHEISYFILVILMALLALKFWIISVLGSFWTTKIIRVPGSTPVAKGPYRYFKHPNYAEVVLEIAAIPLVFHLVYTAILFSLLNAAILYVRISAENKAWAEK